MTGKVYFIGAGPGDPELLTLKAARLIGEAGLIIYAGSLVSRAVLAGAGADAKILDSSSMDLDEIVSELTAAARNGLIAARLHTGDPSLYGAIAEQMARLDAAGVSFEIVPGVSSACAAAAAIPLEYTQPGGSQSLIITRRAGRTPVPDREGLSMLAQHGASMAVFLSAGMLEDVVRELLEGNYEETTPAAVVYRATWPDEKVIRGTLADIAARTAEAGIDRHALIIVGDCLGGAPAETSRLYAPEFSHAFRRARSNRLQGTAIIAVSRRGWHTGKRLLHGMEESRLYVPERFCEEERDERVLFYKSLEKTVSEAFECSDKVIFIMATGIAVRMIAPLLKSKWEDPAVVSLDDGGRNSISLVSGHWGGANELAVTVARILGGNPVITTESDVMGFPAVDTVIKTLTGDRPPQEPDVVKNIQTAILEDEDVGFFPRELMRAPQMKGHPNIHFFDSIEALVCSTCSAGLIVSHHAPQQVRLNDRFLVVQPRDLVVGIGCHAGLGRSELEAGVRRVFADKRLSVDSIAAVCSIDRRKKEQGLIDFAAGFNAGLHFYSADDIARVPVPSQDSEHALNSIGVHGVAEPSAILGAQGGRLLVHKVRLAGMTVAVARIPLAVFFEGSDSHDE